MADNRITIQAEFGQNYKDLGFIGRVGENDSREIVFDCADALTQFPGASIVCVIKRACDTKPYSAALTDEGYNRILPLSAVENAVAGQIMIELRAVLNDTILKSAMFSGRISESLQGEGDRPGNPVRDVLDRVDSALQSATETQKKLLSALDGVDTAVDGANTAAKNAQTVADTVQAKLDNGDFVGPAGKDGKQGPKGDTGATGPQGAPGSDASVTAENVQAALGYTPVKDVQMDGESLVQDSVATIPLAGYNRLGAVQLDPAGFAAASIDGKLALVPPTDAQISTHTHTQRPITPSCMDYAVKAALCDGKGAAWTAAEQKAARERMGTDGDYVLIESLKLAEATQIFERNSEPDGTPYNLIALKVIVKFIPGQASGGLYFYAHRSSGSIIAGGASERIRMLSADSNQAYRSTAVVDVKPLFGLYDCTISQGYQGDAMKVTRAANGAYQLSSAEIKIAKFDFNLFGDGNLPIIAGTEISIYGVRA